MFNTRCFFLGHNDYSAWPGLQTAPPLDTIRREYDQVLALETGPAAANLFTYRPAGRRLALFVGNERRGLSPAVRRAADAMLQIPMRRPAGQSLNVAAAAVVGLGQLRQAASRLPLASGPRPALLFAHPGSPAELGSALRAAWALGWDRVSLLDSRAVWFTRDRATYVQGRGAARRHKNPIAVVPCRLDPPGPPYTLGVIITPQGHGPSFWQTRLPRSPRTLVVVPDTHAGAPSDPEMYSGLASTIYSMTLDLPAPARSYPYHLSTAVVLAELARRQGWPR